MRMAAIALGCMATHVASCGKSERETPTPAVPQGAGDIIAIPASLGPTERAAAEAARAAFLAACAEHPIVWSDFSEVSVLAGEASTFLADQFDWGLVVTIRLKFKEDADQRRAGHVITFEMGAGRRPGIVTRKSHGIHLCRFEGRAQSAGSGKPCAVDGGGDCILDVPSLKVIDAARPPAVVASSRVAPTAWCFAVGFKPPTFWTCAAAEKACNKARAAEKREANGDYQVRSPCERTESLNCFTTDAGQTVCAPDAAACTSSRHEWDKMNTVTPCEVGSAEMLAASAQSDD